MSWLGEINPSILLRSSGPHFAAQPPLEVKRVKRMRSNSLIFPTSLSHEYLVHAAFLQMKPRALLEKYTRLYSYHHLSLEIDC